VSVLLGDGTGGFGPHTDFATGSSPWQPAVGDLNGDGRPDLAVANSGSHSVSVLLNYPTSPKPGAPTILAVTGGIHAATLSWNPPLSDGGSPITGYVVTPYHPRWVLTPVTFNSTATTQTMTGLVDGWTYTFTVAAINAFGTGPESAPSVPITLATVPGSPTIANVTTRNQGATVSWTAPTSDGGTPVTGYLVTPYTDGVAPAPVRFNSTATTQTITGLTNGVTYTFTVAATNAVGTGFESAPSHPVTPGAPDAPTILHNATAANQSATISWLAPASDGGSPIIVYVVTAYVGYDPMVSVLAGPGATSRTVRGLTTGTTYRFRVRAFNAIGASDFSKVTNPVTPSA
jgi:titin